MFKQANKTFLIIGLLVIFALVWLLLKELGLNINPGDDLNDDDWLAEMGLTKVIREEEELWPAGLPAKQEWADYLEECLGKSDDISLKRCQYILSQIDSYTDCLWAGFARIESDPEQCLTSDGQLFIND